MKTHLKKLNGHLKEFVKNYGMILGLSFSVIALGLSGYNTYILNSKTAGNLVAAKKVDKLTEAEIEKIIKNGAPVMGNIEAPVTVVEFADFQCPYCGKYHAQVFPELKEKYIDTGKIRFVYVSYAFLGEESLFAAEAANCAADQGKFWEYHDYLYKNQQGENRGVFSQENLKSFGKKVGLNSNIFDQCVDNRKHKDKVASETQLATKFGVTGTPATFVNDFYISGLQGNSYFVARIETALKDK